MAKTLIVKELPIDGKMTKVLAASYSQIDSFLSCKYKWYLDYLLGKRSSGKAEALDLGSAIHETLEIFGKKIKEGQELELAESLKTLDEQMDKNDIKFANEDNEKEAIEQHKNMVEGLISKDNELSKLLLNNKIIGIEMPFVYKVKLPFKVKVYDDIYDCVYLNGAIDLVLEDKEGNYIVVDYKSGKKKFDNAKLKTNLQHRIYSAVVNEKFGKLPTRCVYYFTRLDTVQDVEPMCLYEDDAVDHYYDKGRYKGNFSHRQFSLESLHKTLINIFTEMYAPEKVGKYSATASPLCSWCSHGLYSEADCKYAMEFVRKDIPMPKRKRRKERGVSCI